MYCVLSHIIAKYSKSFAESEFIKESLIDSAAILSPDKKELFDNVSLSRRIVTWRVEDISENMEQQYGTTERQSKECHLFLPGPG